ncbi:MAG: hypothetical protein U0R19_41105 [Bryobacteraceae bacterium]
MAPTRPPHVLAVALAALLAFGFSVRGTLLADDFYVVKQRLAMPVASFWTDDYWAGYAMSGLYRPLGLCWLWLQRQAFGDVPAGYHVVSLVLHAITSGLFYLVLEPLLTAKLALAAALLFAVHPVHAEAVLPVYGQLDEVAGLLTLAAILACRNGRHVWGIAAIGAAMLVKESAFIGVGLLWLLVRPSWRVLTPYAGVTVAAAGLRFAALGSMILPGDATVIGPDASLTLWVKSIVISVAHALRLSAFPTGQTVYYGHLRDSLTGFPSSELTWLATTAMVAVSLLWVLPRREWILGFGWFTICIFPVANVVPIGVMVAERSLYLAVGGIVLLAARAKPMVLAVAAIAALGACWHVTYQWRTELALWESTVAAHPRSPKAHAMVGWSLLRQMEGESGEKRERMVAEAESAFERTLALNPRSADALTGRALLRWSMKGCEAARTDLETAIQASPNDDKLTAAVSACR